ncbi:hypothetical protein FHT00_002698 [Sphingomonas insulae]|uniref:Uracil-DNA glycosylase n=1 Tax=Sphingomonas insulae TaxID=424800 RepID=A0ABN1HPA6_9SPHN|nr:hypothetical protein [Sphingomonas insulae]
MNAWASGQQFTDMLADISLANVFNPYSDVCSVHDLANAPAIRRANLTAVLEAALAQGAAELWVGLELGARGGRRTGLALTDEAQLETCGDYWATSGLNRATSGSPVKEQTATYIWQALPNAKGRVFLWNAFPLHCHQPGCLTNRGHTRSEVDKIPAILPWLARALNVQRVVALGRGAELAARRAGLDPKYVRHPGRGGGPQFLTSVHKS